MTKSKYFSKLTPTNKSKEQAELFTKYGFEYPIKDESIYIDTLAIRKDLKANNLLITKLEKAIGKEGIEALDADEYKAIIKKYLLLQWIDKLATDEEAIELIGKVFTSDELIALWWETLKGLDPTRRYADDIWIDWTEAALKKLGIDPDKETEDWDFNA